MSDRRPPWARDAGFVQPVAGDPDLERADDLLDQADAFLRRHRAGFADAAHGAEQEARFAPFDDEDLPILTDVVDESELWPAQAAAGAQPAPAAPAASPPAAAAPAPVADALRPGPASVIDRLADARSRHLAAQARAGGGEIATGTHGAAAAGVEAAIARAVETWLADELPQILARELAQISFRINAEVGSSLRAAVRSAALAAASARTSDVSGDEPGTGAGA